VSWFWCFSSSWAKWLQFWNDISPFPYAGTASIAFILCSSTWIPLNQYFFKKADETERILVREGGALEQLLDHAMKTQKHVMVTLKNDKVYYGRIDSSFTPGQLSRTIGLFPTKSGYRTPEKKAVPAVDYDTVYAEIASDFTEQGRKAEGEVLVEDFRVVFALDDIASISLYWEELDARYFKKTVPRDKELPSFKIEPLPKEEDPDPFLRLFNYIGGRILYFALLEEAWADKPSTRRWRLGLGIGAVTIVLYIIARNFSN
jgi:hypothetical protein